MDTKIPRSLPKSGIKYRNLLKTLVFLKTMKNPKLSSSSKPSSFSSHNPHSNRKSRLESNNNHHPDHHRRPSPPPPPPSDPNPNPNPKPKPKPKPKPPSSSSNPNPKDAPCSSAIPPSASSATAAALLPLPTYGFQNLERRSIVLFDGSVRSYFALPPDYPLEPRLGFDRQQQPQQFSPDFFRSGGGGGGDPVGRDFPPRGPPPDWLSGMRGPPEGPSSLMKRKYPEDEFAWHRQHVSQYGNANANPRSPMRRGHEDERRGTKQVRLGGEGYGGEVAARRGRGGDDDMGAPPSDVDPQALKRAFLKFAKVFNDNEGPRSNYLEDGKKGPLQCLVCDRASEIFSDVHGLIMHAYNSHSGDLRVDHLGLHKALCVLMGWNYAKAPESSKAYQSLSADLASANREDLIIMPPTVMIHNMDSGRRSNGRMEGLGNKEMDMKLKDLGFSGGKSKSIYGKEGHSGVTVVKFANTQAGLKEAERLAEYFEKENHGCKDWAQAQASHCGSDKEKNSTFVKVDPKSGVKQRIMYGYLATASDLEMVDFDLRRKAIIKSRREFDQSE